MLFGKNIKMTDKHFIPVIVPNYDVEEALKIIKINVIKKNDFHLFLEI